MVWIAYIIKWLPQKFFKSPSPQIEKNAKEIESKFSLQWELLGFTLLTIFIYNTQSCYITLLTKVPIVKAMVCSHVQMWELDHEEGWALKYWCFWIVVLEKTLESPLDCTEIKPVSPKGNQPWISIQRTDAEAQVLQLWPPDAKSWLIRKDPDAGKDWRQKEKGMIWRWDCWLASLTPWTWVWASSVRWWRTGRPGMLQSKEVGHDWATEQQQQDYLVVLFLISEESSCSYPYFLPGPMYIPTKSAGGCSFLHILANSCYFLSW